MEWLLFACWDPRQQFHVVQRNRGADELPTRLRYLKLVGKTNASFTDLMMII